jgi:hypothetical protein
VANHSKIRCEDALRESVLRKTDGAEELERLLEKRMSQETPESTHALTFDQRLRGLDRVPGYPYRPLDSKIEETRILVVLPSLDTSATIQCKLISSIERPFHVALRISEVRKILMARTRAIS